MKMRLKKNDRFNYFLNNELNTFLYQCLPSLTTNVSGFDELLFTLEYLEQENYSTDALLKVAPVLLAMTLLDHQVDRLVEMGFIDNMLKNAINLPLPYEFINPDFGVIFHQILQHEGNVDILANSPYLNSALYALCNDPVASIVIFSYLSTTPTGREKLKNFVGLKQIVDFLLNVPRSNLKTLMHQSLQNLKAEETIYRPEKAMNYLSSPYIFDPHFFQVLSAAYILTRYIFLARSCGIVGQKMIYPVLRRTIENSAFVLIFLLDMNIDKIYNYHYNFIKKTNCSNLIPILFQGAITIPLIYLSRRNPFIIAPAIFQPLYSTLANLISNINL